MYDKNFYRTSLNNYKKYIKLGVFCDEIGLSRSTLSIFLKGSSYDYMISIERLHQLFTHIHDTLNIS